MKHIVYIVFAFVIFSCNPNTPKIETGIEKIEELVLLERYREAAKECENILNNPNIPEIRTTAADYLLLCLLKTGNLNNKFYVYKARIKEMPFPIPMNPTIARSCFQFECGIPFSSFEINTMLSDGHQKSPVFWNLFEKNSIITKRERYYFAVRNNTVVNNIISSNTQTKIDKENFLQEWNGKIQSTPPEIKIFTGGDFLGKVFQLFGAYQNNKEILESHAAMMLFYKRLHLLPEILERYGKLGYARLPDYVQEAVVIFLQNTEIDYFYGYEIEEKIKKQHKEFEQAMRDLYRGKTQEEIKEKFGHTYAYYFYMQE
jgi:hypothetical protein